MNWGRKQKLVEKPTFCCHSAVQRAHPVNLEVTAHKTALESQVSLDDLPLKRKESEVLPINSKPDLAVSLWLKVY